MASVLSQWQSALQTALFGRDLLSYSGFVELERVVEKSRLYWEIQTPDGNFSVPTIAHELDSTAIEKVLIVGSGPSLNETLNADLAQGDAVIFLNGAARFLNRVRATHRYLAVSDPIFVRHNISLIVDCVKSGAILLLTEACLMVLLRQNPAISRDAGCFRLYELVGSGAAHYFSVTAELNGNELMLDPSGDDSQRVGWSKNVEKGVFSGATVAFPALQIAVGLSADIIECHGIDLCGSGRAYTDQRPQISKLDRHLEQYIRPSFQFASQQLKGTGVVVRNHSPICPISFSQLFDQ